jgi:hypothetical protein
MGSIVVLSDFSMAASQDEKNMFVEINGRPVAEFVNRGRVFQPTVVLHGDISSQADGTIKVALRRTFICDQLFRVFPSFT